MTREVLVVHCIDTEGPMRESLQATFDRLGELFGIEMEPTRHNLQRLQKQHVDLDGNEAVVATVVAPHLLAYNDTWDAVDDMLDEMLSPEFRSQFTDSFENGWIYNWHCVDHIGYLENPRRRDIGHHNVFDHYRHRLAETNSSDDGLHFHYHPMSLSRSAHHNATHYFAQDNSLFQILARRIIDRHWFPSVYRAGFHVLRPDSHWFLEQYIPFSYSNQAREPDSTEKNMEDGRFGDWRRAPRNWQPYHPDHDDYQLAGQCRRWETRCLNVGTRHSLLRRADVEQAFREAAEGKPAVLAFTNHDFRDMRPDVESTWNMLSDVASDYPDVKFRHAEAREAMRSALGLKPVPFDLQLTLTENRLRITCAHETFGPQPFLAIKSRGAEYYHENLDVQIPRREWSFVFDEHSLPLESVETVGVASCSSAGDVSVSVLDPSSGRTTATNW